MSCDYDFSGSDYPTAVAAAAYAVKSLQESETWNKEETTYGPDKTLSKMKSKIDDTGEKPKPLKSALKSSDGTSKTNFGDPDSASTSKRTPTKQPSFKKKISFAETDEIINEPEKLPMEKAPEKAPSLRRPSTFADKELNITENRMPDAPLPKPDRPPTRLPTTQPVETRRPATKPGPGDSAADAWEKEEMASMKERYEKLRVTIDNWESKKKKKAKSRIERIEAELDEKMVKALQKYHIDITRIEGIAGGARAQAEENSRNEEFRVKEKANRIRATGKLPATCLCL